MSDIKHKIVVLSGKGGVGKSTVAVNLAVWLSMKNKKVGLLDVDIHGPSVPKLLGLEGKLPQGHENGIEPIQYSENLKVMSVGFLLQDANKALIWRGPMKHNVIKQFVSDVNWGILDYLIVDCPPGTGDEPLSVIQLLNELDGGVVVTTPQDVAIADVKKCITFCIQMKLPVLGVVENMSGFVCPHCNKRTNIFACDGGEKLAEDFNVPFLGSIPIDPAMVGAGDSGKVFVRFNNENPTSQALNYAFESLMQFNKTKKENDSKMKIAIPLTNGVLSAHFGHCEQFAVVEVDENSKEIKRQQLLTPPAHEPGVLPKWLAEVGVSLIIAGGMGQRAQQLFEQDDIKVLCGVTEDKPEDLVKQYLAGKLTCGENICDH